MKRGNSSQSSRNELDNDNDEWSQSKRSKTLKIKAKRKSKKKKCQTSEIEESKQDETIADITENSNGDEPSRIDNLQKQIDGMRAELQTQYNTISDLTTRLTFVLSLLNIENEVSDKNKSSNASTLAAGSTTLNGFAAAAATRPSVVTADRMMRQSVVAAVYVDDKLRQNRANNFVVTGLSPSTEQTDQQLIINLCLREFKEQIEVVYCKRLGKLLNDRVQPLLVILRSVSQTQMIISKAKLLRNSADEVTKHHLYISANLTKAEARAAYELRCQRRQAADRRNNQRRQQQSAQQSMSPVVNVVATTNQPISSSSSQQTQQQTSTVIGSYQHPSHTQYTTSNMIPSYNILQRQEPRQNPPVGVSNMVCYADVISSQQYPQQQQLWHQHSLEQTRPHNINIGGTTESLPSAPSLWQQQSQQLPMLYQHVPITAATGNFSMPPPSVAAESMTSTMTSTHNNLPR